MSSIPSRIPIRPFRIPIGGPNARRFNLDAPQPLFPKPCFPNPVSQPLFPKPCYPSEAPKPDLQEFTEWASGRPELVSINEDEATRREVLPAATQSQAEVDARMKELREKKVERMRSGISGFSTAGVSGGSTVGGSTTAAGTPAPSDSGGEEPGSPGPPEQLGGGDPVQERGEAAEVALREDAELGRGRCGARE